MKKNLTLLFIVVLLMTLSACQTPTSDVMPTVSNEGDLPTDTVEPTDAPIPTATSIPETIILYDPTDTAAGEIVSTREWLTNWAAEYGFLIDVKSQLSFGDIPKGTSVVVVFNENGVDVNALAQERPETNFVVKRESSLGNQPANVVTLVADSAYLNFAAGYLSILIAPDWRLGALLPWDDEVSGAETLQAFSNGSAYHCGRCASTFMPVVLFPVTSSLPSTSAPETWMNEVLTLDNVNYLYTVYVAPEAASEQLYQQLVTQNVTVVGAKKPENIEGLLWAASINQDATAALIENWDAILNGTLAENEIIVPVVVTEVNDEYLSPGRLRLYDEMMNALVDGWLSPISPDYP